MPILGKRQARTILYSVTILIALTISLAATYTYGALFQHDRYWEGTIKRVQDTQIAMLEATLDDPVMLRQLIDNEDRVQDLLNVLEGKIAITIYRSDQQVASNRINEWKIRNRERALIEPGDIRVRIAIYEPPTWNRQFTRWLYAPSRWLLPGYDHITAPFIAFFLFSFMLGLAVLWRYRARHLEKDVMNDLRRLGVR